MLIAQRNGESPQKGELHGDHDSTQDMTVQSLAYDHMALVTTVPTYQYGTQAHAVVTT